jgi:hypothetical protein
LTPRRSVLAVLSLGALGAVSAFGIFPGCAKPEKAPGVRARFGVFFGGDVQERDELPLIFDRSRQTYGIRLDFDEAPSSPLRVAWEIEKPGTGRDGGGGLVDYGEVKTREGARTLDIPLSFRAGDKPGAWRVRVTLENKSVIERSFRVVPPSSEPAPAIE